MKLYKTYETELAGRKLTLETGKLAGLANGSVLVRYGDTVVLVDVTASKEPRDGIDFFPLSVDYEEKLYAVGKIPGSYTKREGKPSDKAILTSRAIDRPLRPLFPKDFRNDVCVVATVLSVEQDNQPEICAMIGASAALSISDIPFGGPTAAVAVGYVNDEIIINPTEEQRKNSRLTLTVAGTEDKIAMIEAGADEIPDDIMLEAIEKAHKEIKKLCTFISKMQNEIGKPKFEYKSFAVDEEIYNEVEAKYKDKLMSDCKRRNKELEYVLILIDRYIDNKKPKLLAKLYLAFLDTKISWNTFAEMSEIIDRLFVSDLNSLCEFYYHGGVIIKENKVSIASVLRLLSVGFVEQQTNIIWHEAGSADTQKSKSDFDYYITDFGKQFIDIFKDDILKNKCLI